MARATTRSGKAVPSDLNNRRKKKAKEAIGPVDTDMDDISVETEKRSGTPSRVRQTKQSKFIYREHITFFDVMLSVKKSTQGTSEMRRAFVEFMKVLKDADEEMIITPYKAGNDLDDDAYMIEEDTIIQEMDQLPATATALGKFFFRGKANSRGGKVYGSIRVAHSTDLDTLLCDIDQEVRDNSSRIFVQSLQHHDTKGIGFLHLFNESSDLKFWTTWLQDQLKIVLKKNEDVKIGLKCKIPFTGLKKEENKGKGGFNEQSRAIHVEAIREQAEEIEKGIKFILKGSNFKSIYKVPVRLVPLYDRNKSSLYNTKIRRLITQHGQAGKCTTYSTVEGVEYIDSEDKDTNLTLREMVLDIQLQDGSGPLFHTIDENWLRTGYSLFWAKLNDDEGKLVSNNLPAYLAKTFGDSALKFFSTDQQVKAKETTWTEDGIPHSKIDLELDEMLDETEGLSWINMEVLKKEEEPKVLEFIPDKINVFGIVDDDTISTFAESPYKKTRHKEATTLTSDNDTATVSDCTIDSRLSTMERSFSQHQTVMDNNMAQIMEMLMKNKSEGSTKPEESLKSADADVSAPSVQ